MSRTDQQLKIVQHFASQIQSNFQIRVDADPEDQLKGPLQELIQEIGAFYSFKVGSRTETQTDVGKPDVGVTVDGILCGYIELKAPGKGSRHTQYKGHDRTQWKKFQSLPNLLYTDGNQWTLYRTGSVEGTTLTFSGDIIQDGKQAISESDAERLFDLFHDFYLWHPIVPDSPVGLAKVLAPICQFIRKDVVEQLELESSNLRQLYEEWQETLFPDLDESQFADAYTQTLTYGILLARLNGEGHLTAEDAPGILDTGHKLLAQALRVLIQQEAREEIQVSVDLLERVIDAVDAEALAQKERNLWLYFYEDFLKAYDKNLQKKRGVVYTPPEVISAQINLTSQLLQERFNKNLTFADEGVTFLDPAAGTGAYVLAVIEHGLKQVENELGPGMVGAKASELAKNIHAFELLVGPYTVAHLRVTQGIVESGGEPPEDGIQVYLTDTLESPNTEPTPQTTLFHKRLNEEHKRALKVKAEKPILVCMGNPPYDREQAVSGETITQRKGGWVRYGDKKSDRPILADFLEPLEEENQSIHAKNLYNDYVYFWRWALWKVFESTGEAGILSFITAASYLRGPGFIGMRKVMREVFDEIWIIDLEGDNRGARKTENVFDIQTPVAIATGIRDKSSQSDTPAKVHYTKIEGTQEAKLAQLQSITHFNDVEWRECYSGWYKPFLPEGHGDYYSWPLLKDIFPWQHSGVQYKRKWPIEVNKVVLRKRWKKLVSTEKTERSDLFKETRDRKVSKQYSSIFNKNNYHKPIKELSSSEPPPKIIRYSYRSFDRQWAFLDNRLGDFLRPVLWQIYSENQIFVSSFLTGVLGEGPSIVASAYTPDLDFFRGSFGGKHVIPLWRDPDATQPNICTGLLGEISSELQGDVHPEELLCYTYGLLASPGYVERFSEELIEPGPRLPITKNSELFQKTVEYGKQLIWLHTYGERFIPEGSTTGKIPAGTAKSTQGISQNPADYPDSYSYEAESNTLIVGDGKFAPVSQDVWEFEISGMNVVQSWLSYRMKSGAGRKSSPLDDIRPEVWTARMSQELLELLWVLEKTIDLYPELEENLDKVIASDLWAADELPTPDEEERKIPKLKENKISNQISLIDE